jgi:hypothetical protein
MYNTCGCRNPIINLSTLSGTIIRIMKKNLVNVLKFLIVGVVLVVGVNYAFAAIKPPIGSTFKLSVAKDGAGTGIVSSVPGNIICGPVCSDYYSPSTTVTLYAYPSPGSYVAGAGGCDSMGGSGQMIECTVLMSSARSVVIYFYTNLNTLIVMKDGTGTGTVTSAPSGINCGTTCFADYSPSTTVVLTGIPLPGSTVNGASGCDSMGGSSWRIECTVLMSSARSVIFHFESL